MIIYTDKQKNKFCNMTGVKIKVISFGDSEPDSSGPNSNTFSINVLRA